MIKFAMIIIFCLQALVVASIFPFMVLLYFLDHLEEKLNAGS